jgi:hypothetical protein
MHAVLYTHQLEPITVVDIPMFLWDRLARGETIMLAVMEPVLLRPYTAEEIGPAPRRVAIFGERHRRGDHETLMLFTRDEENALMLKAEFLPGQRGEVRNRERGAFAAGFLRALQEFGA